RACRGSCDTGIPVPVEIVHALGAGRRHAVTVKVNEYQYRSTIASMGGQFLIPFSAALRAETGIGGGMRSRSTSRLTPLRARWSHPRTWLKRWMLRASVLRLMR